MSIALIGTGVVAVSLAKALLAIKRNVIFGTREPAGDKAAAILNEAPGSHVVGA